MTASTTCANCGASTGAADTYYSLRGAPVCRICHFAEQTRLQEVRVQEETNREIGLFGAIKLAKHWLEGGLLTLIGTAGLLGAIRERAWRVAGWCALLAAFGVILIVVALRRAKGKG